MHGIHGQNFAERSGETRRPQLPRYVLVTPARNEAAFIEKTIQSVIGQSVLPLKWVIVSDGSTDGTDEIVSRYLPGRPWMELVQVTDRGRRDFAGKVYAFQAGYARLAGLDYDFVGNLDADVSFEPDYFEFLLSKFLVNTTLGLAGTPFREGAFQYDFRFASLDHVSGPIQLFRRQCFEEIGGYVPVAGGCVDHIAVISARMKNWKTRTFTGKLYVHHRKMGTAEHGTLIARFRNGAKDYAIGNHPVWELLRVTWRTMQRPYVLGGVMVGCGYLVQVIRRAPRPVSPELVRFYRHEQMLRLRKLFRSEKEPLLGPSQARPEVV